MSRTVSKQPKDPNRKTSNELGHEEAKKFLDEKKIKPGTTKIKQPEREIPVTSKKSLLIRTNIYNIIVKENKPVYKYNVKITGHLRDLEPIEFTKSSASELFGVDRMDVCSKVFNALFELEPEVFDSRNKFYYNLCAVLYSVEELGEDYHQKFAVQELFAAEEEIDFLVKLRGRETFEVDITLEDETDNADFAERLTRMNTDRHDMEAVRFAEVVTWQNAIQSPAEHVIFPKGRSYLSNPIERGYHENEMAEYGNGIYLGIGLSKTSKLIEGENGKECGAIVVEPKVMLFHRAEDLIVKLRPLLENTLLRDERKRELMRELVSGLYFMSSHWIQDLEKVRMFRIHDVGEPASVQRFEFVNRETEARKMITVADYFAQKDFRLTRPELPVIVVRRRGDEFSYYPMEHVVLMDNQSVSHMNQDLTREFIRNSAVTPRILQNRIDISRNVLFLENSEFMANAGIEVSQQPIKIEVPVLTAPQMKYGGNYVANFDEFRSDWKADRINVVVPSVLERWCAFVAINSGARPQFTDDNFQNFLETFQNECCKRGIIFRQEITHGERIVLEPNDLYKNLHDAMKFAGENGYKLALVITNASDKRVHSDLKAYEQKYGVVTQNVTHKVALATLGIGVNGPSSLTLGNIVNKTNMKLGGLNYVAGSGNKMLGETDLFLGFTLNHLAAGIGNLRETTVPSILGYSANDTNNLIGFTGDFIYTKPSHRGFLPSIFEAACTVFQRFLTNRRIEPERVIVYRGGCSDGEIDYVIIYEVPVLRQAIKEVLKSNPKLVLISVNKIHNVRFTHDKVPLPQGNLTRPKIQNIPSGVVIDSKVVRPIPEFYLASHCAIQGTVKVPRYNILCNDADANLPELEKITHELCFCHQIINSPISVPSPLYCAEENAKRGRNLYNAEVNGNFIGQSKRELGLEGEINHDDPEVRRRKEQHAAALTGEMSYAHLDIRGQRFNA